MPTPVAAAHRPAPSDPFVGVGTWVSIFVDTWDRPREHVRRMHAEGVTTLYLQSSSSRTPATAPIFRPDRVARFIEAAHARGMKVVAWYLPPLADVGAEYERAMAAIRFRTPRGERFDGFALDIEPSATTPGVTRRNENLLRLSRKIRRSTPEGYPLGGIIPSPIGMRLSPEFWPRFPYDTVGRFYDVVLPMSYHTYRVNGAAATYTYTRDNIDILRRRLGPDVRLHVIGGEAQASNRRETRAFVRAVNDAGVPGASLWHHATHGPEDWEALRNLGSAPTRVATADPPSLELSRAAFSPNGDGRADTTTLMVHSPQPATLRLEVRDGAGSVLRRWPSSSADATTLAVDWNGRAGGTRLSDGRYVVRAVATDASGRRQSVRTSVRVDTRPPALAVRPFTAPLDAAQPIAVRYATRDRSDSVHVLVALRGIDAIRSKAVRHPAGDRTVTLAPRYRDGHRLLPGAYDIAVTATDAAGNRATASRRLVVLRPTAAALHTRVENTGRMVALTFDDCHLPDSWRGILDTLAREQVRATFFCPGDRIELYPDLARRTVTDGHVPAAHGGDHAMLTRLSLGDVRRRLERDRAAWAGVGGTSAPYFRPPYGAVNATVLAAAGATSHPRVMLWDVDSRDYTGVLGQRLVCNATCTARPGSVILLHTNPRTAAALPAILAALRAKKLRPVGLPELFRAGGHH